MLKELILGLGIIAGIVTVVVTKTPTVNVNNPTPQVNVTTPQVDVTTPAPQVNVTTPVPQVDVNVPEQLVGGSQSQDHYNPEYFRNGLYGNKFFSLSSVNASSTSSTAPTLPLALSAGSHGVITVGTSTPAVRTTYASTTAVTANSTIYFAQTASGPAGVTCNSTGATSTIYTTYTSSTNISLNGFAVTLGSIPTTNPVCLSYWIVDRSTSGY